MKDADQETSLQATSVEPPVRGLLRDRDRPPRYRKRPQPPPASSPAGIASTVAGVLAMPLLVVLELGIETMRTLRSVFALKRRDS